MDLNDAPTWRTNRERINGLWPKFTPTDEERKLIAERLANLNQRILLAAVDEYRWANSSIIFKLADLLDIYRRIAATGAQAARRPAEDPVSRKRREEEELRRDEDRCRSRLASTDRAAIASAVTDLRKAGWIRKPQLSPRIDEWTRQQVFLVVARLDLGSATVAAMPQGGLP